MTIHTYHIKVNVHSVFRCTSETDNPEEGMTQLNEYLEKTYKKILPGIMGKYTIEYELHEEQ